MDSAVAAKMEESERICSISNALAGVESTSESTEAITESSTFITISYWTTPLSSISVTVTVESLGNTASASSVFLMRFWNTILASSFCAGVRVDVSKLVLKKPVVEICPKIVSAAYSA